jgi:tetratricopeptide (TPR) repeat protein
MSDNALNSEQDQPAQAHQPELSAEKRHALESELLFVELKKEVYARLELPQRVPILKADLQTEFKNGAIPPTAFAAGIEALKLLHPALQDYDNFLVRYYLLEGRRALDENDEYEAQRFYHKALDLQRGKPSAEAAYYLAVLSQGDQEQAINYYQQSLELNPNAATPHFELGRLLRERRDLQGALHEFGRAFELEPTSANAINAIAETYLMAGDLTAARETFQQALRLEPNNWVLLVRLGITEYDEQDYPAAIKNLRRGLDNAPDELEEGNSQSFYVDGLYYLGQAYRASGDDIRALKLFKTVLSLAPDHVGALQALS